MATVAGFRRLSLLYGVLFLMERYGMSLIPLGEVIVFNFFDKHY